MIKTEETNRVRKPELLNGIAKWGPVVALCYALVFMLQVRVIFPLELSLFSGASIASLVWLPHAALVLSTVIIGPRVFIVLLPTYLAIYYFDSTIFVRSEFSIRFVLAAIAGAGCAPVAYMLVKFLRRNNLGEELDLANWRTVLLIGAVASIINSVLKAILFGRFFGGRDFAAVATKVFVGDLMGLMLGLVLLLFIFRLINRDSLANTRD